MRKSKIKEITDNIHMLEKLQEKAGMAIQGQAYAQAMELLISCQEKAIEAGNRIELLKGEGFRTVLLLENYCEQLYLMHEKLSCPEFAQMDELYRNLQEILVQVGKSVKKDIIERREIVFLPYKASMWDSLESVWRDAAADSMCDVYVIPIPYYDKRADGSFGEMHIEADEYPAYVPITSYEDYHIEQRLPDVIFIHNPYDGSNRVTSVHPMFYAKNLKEYTDKLVYIPYFVLNEIDPQDERAAAGIEKFVALPGVIHADRVIVQSEDMRQVYINVMTRLVGEKTKSFWEQKILGLGSPKVDKVLRTKREGVDIPKEWRRILQKPDGSSKKVIFYNISVSALLRNKENMIKKIQNVLQVFKENREDVALLWRPHPLMLATIESMRPQLLEEYKKIVAQYKEEGWGIYDDTADLNRAIAISDAYYGDKSSVVWLCQKVNMPVMIQNVYVISE